MKNEDRVGVALVKELCPICCKELDGPIILNSRLTKKAASDVKSMHGKVIGFAEKPCPECQKLIDEGCFFVLAVAGEPKVRTGAYCGIKRESEFVQNLPDEYKKHNAILMDYDEMVKLGMLHE